MRIGQATFDPIRTSEKLVAASVAKYTKDHNLLDDIFVVEIDPTLSDTVSFCENYGVSMDISTNCLIIEARRADKVWYAACLILANDMADVNGAVRRQLNARKISFAPKETALSLTKMEYGGITPIGLPSDWPILIDEDILKRNVVVMGSGVRKSKISVKTDVLKTLPNFTILNIKK